MESMTNGTLDDILMKYNDRYEFYTNYQIQILQNPQNDWIKNCTKYFRLLFKICKYIITQTNFMNLFFIRINNKIIKLIQTTIFRLKQKIINQNMYSVDIPSSADGKIKHLVKFHILSFKLSNFSSKLIIFLSSLKQILYFNFKLNQLVINKSSGIKQHMDSHISNNSKPSTEYEKYNEFPINHQNYNNFQHTQQFSRQLKRNNDSNSQLIKHDYQNNHMNNSKMSKKSIANQRNRIEIQLGIEKVSQLTERLKNIHHFYKIRIEQEKTKNVERNEVFMTIIEQLQNSHNKKIQMLKAEISQAQQEKKQVGLVDDRMNEIKGSIDDILKQSSGLKASNQRLQSQISEKEKILKEKEQECERLKKDVVQYRTQLQNFQRMKLKQNKKNREMLEMIDNILPSRKEK